MMLAQPSDSSTAPRRRILDELTLSDAKARILLALSVLGHAPGGCATSLKVEAILRGELTL